MVRMFAWGLLALAAFAGPASAQSLADYDYDNLTFRGVGFDFGHIWPTKVNPTSSYSIRLDLGFLGPAVRIAPSLTYWSSQFRTSELERLANRLEELPVLRDHNVDITAQDLGVVKWSDLSLNLDAHVVWTAPFNLITYVGGGLGLHALNGRGDAIADTFIEDLLDTTTAGVALSTGLEFQPVERFRFYGEARYTIVSDVRYPGIRVGAALMLPPVQAALTTPQGGR